MKSNEKCGIYQIRCVISGKFYIGSSVQIYRRWSQHRQALRRGANGCHRLQRAWNKHGEDAFAFSILEECSSDVLLQREQHHIDTLNPDYNMVRDIPAGPIALALASNRIRWASITHCPRGHEYTEANTYRGPNGGKICRQCNADRVAKIYESQTEEQREARRNRVKEHYESNREKYLELGKSYTATHKEEKSLYDKVYRAEAVERRQRRLAAETPEQTAERLRLKRAAYHTSKGRDGVDAGSGQPHNKGIPMSDEQKAKISATLVEWNKTNGRPANEPWVALGISKTSWYRRQKRLVETPEDVEKRRAYKREAYHRNGDKEREAMRKRYRDRVEQESL